VTDWADLFRAFCGGFAALEIPHKTWGQPCELLVGLVSAPDAGTVDLTLSGQERR
jgi:hypothetical protein